MALLSTLPGDIPGLIRRGSPLLDCGHPCLCREVFHDRDGSVASIRHDRAYHADGRVDSFVLDLADPTGRAHAAWWTFQQRDPQEGWTGFPPPISVEEGMARRLARTGADMSPEQIDALARLVLRLAGRTP